MLIVMTALFFGLSFGSNRLNLTVSRWIMGGIETLPPIRSMPPMLEARIARCPRIRPRQKASRKSRKQQDEQNPFHGSIWTGSSTESKKKPQKTRDQGSERHEKRYHFFTHSRYHPPFSNG